MDFRQTIDSKLYLAGLSYESDASGINVWPKTHFPLIAFETCYNYIKRSCFEFQKNIRKTGVGGR